MKKSTIIITILTILAIITASSLAIYQTTISGTFQATCADVIVEVQTEETNLITINQDNLTVQYDFTVNNYITENNTPIINETVCDYYLKIEGLANSMFQTTLYYVDEYNVGTALTLEDAGKFAGYYKATQRLGITDATEHTYRLDIEVDQGDLATLTTNVIIDIGYEQYIEHENHVNAPDLATGLIPVTWDDITDNWVKTSSSNPNWYNYDQRKWANVVTANSNYDDGTNSNLPYSSSPDGTIIPNTDITTMFVWIPRFVYRIDEQYFHRFIAENATLTSPPVGIHFSKTEATGGDEWDENIIVVNSGGRAEDCKNSWTTHSAFQFGDTYLNGIWAGKFQASNSTGTATVSDTIDYVLVRPAVRTATTLRIAKMFQACRNMESNDVYGWTTATNLQNDATFEVDNNGIDIHMTKNSEWSAIAYLTQSKYGRGTTDIDNSPPSTEEYTGGSSDISVIYGTGVGQSSTNNAYGVYEMASTTWDSVAAYIGPGDNINSPDLYNALPQYKNQYMIEGQTIDYTSKDSVYAIFEYFKDAAIWETSTGGNNSYSAWFSGRSNIGSYSGSKYNLLITRGGAYTANNVTTDSTFSFGYGEGNDLQDSRSFRPILCIGTGI